MKIKQIVTAGLLSSVFTVSAHDAVITWSSRNITSIGDVATEGILLEALNFGPAAVSDATVNGVTFSATGSAGPFTHLDADDTLVTAYSSPDFYQGGIAAYDNLLDVGRFKSGGTTEPKTYTISGLTEGKEYLVQFLFADARNASTRTRHHVLDGTHTTPQSGESGYEITGRFIADGPSQVFTVQMYQGASPVAVNMGAYQLRLIPEPATPGLLFSIRYHSGSLQSPAMIMYVCPSGLDTNPGTEAQPFRTIARARDHIRCLAKTEPPGDIIVFLRGGNHRVQETIVFSEADSAAPGHTITYRAYPGEIPILSASSPINDWTEEKLESGKRVWSADVSALLARREQVDFHGVGALDSRAKTSFFTLYDAEGELPRARGKGFQARPLPESDANDASRIFFPEGALQTWPDLAGAELVVIPSRHWVMNILPLAAVDAAGGFATTARPASYPIGPNPITAFEQERPAVWIENVLDVLDEPGEWVLHAAQGKLYLLPRAGGEPEGIEAPELTEIIRVEGAIDYDGSTDRPVRGLVFQGLTFTRGDRLPWSGQTGLGLQHDWEMFDLPTALVRFRGAEECAIIDCRFTDSGHAGVRADLHAQKIRIEGSVFERLGGTAILFAGYGPGTKDVNRNNTVVNNHIHHTGRHYWGAPAIMVWQSGENRIAHNRIHHVPYTGIVISGRIMWNRTGNAECVKTIRWPEVDEIIPRNVRPEWPERERFLHARRNLIEYNEIHNAVETLGDGNAIYVSGAGDGNIVRKNYCHDFFGEHMNAIIRNDDFQNGTEVVGNILCRSRGQGEGIINKGANRIIGNVIADLRPTRGTRGAIVLTGYPQHGTEIRNNLIYAPRIVRGSRVRGWPAISESESNARGRGPSLLKDTDADSNLYWCAEDPAWGEAHLTKARYEGKEIHSIAADPCFVDTDLSTFMLKPGSPALGLGISPFNVTLAGPQEPYRSRWFGKPMRTIIEPAGTVNLEAPITVRIRSTHEKAVIRYTLDGSEPDELSAIYDFPLRIDTPLRVRARSFASGHEDLTGDMIVLETK